MLQKFFDYLLKNQVILALVIVSGVWFVYQIKDILALFFLSYIFMASLLPFVAYFTRHKFPRIFAVLIPYLSVLLLLFLLIFPLIPFFIQQIQALIKGFPTYLNQSANMFGVSLDAKQLEVYLSSQLNNISQNAFLVTKKVFGGFFSLITIIIVSFYLLFYHNSFNEKIAMLFKKDSQAHVLATLQRIDDKLGAWLRGQLLLSFTIGFFTWVALSLIGIPYALPLALIAGIMEVLPTVGPILSSIPAIIVALTISPSLAITVAVIYFLIQFTENHFLVPKIMQHAVGLNPVAVILAIMVGANLMGIEGALLSIPFVSFLIVLFKSATSRNN